MSPLKPNFLDESEIMATARTGRAEDLRRVLKIKARQSLYWTSKVLFNYNALTPSFHLPLCQHIQLTIPELRRIYLVARGWFKSTIVGKTYPMWRLMGGGISDELFNELIEVEFGGGGDLRVPTTVEEQMERLTSFYTSNQDKDPRNHRILILSETQDIADKDIKDPKWHIQNNQQFQWLFPELVPPSINGTVWNNSEILLPRSRSFDESTLTALGLETGGTGFHYSIIVWDDPAGEKAAGSPPLMQKAKDRVQAAPGLFHDPAKTEELGAMTRWKHGTADVAGYMMEEMPFEMKVSPEGKPYPTGYKFYIKDSEYLDDTGKRCSYFPERFPIEVLDSIRAREKDYLYNCNYRNRPTSPEGADFNPDKWREFRVEYNPNALMQGRKILDWIQPLGPDGQPEGPGLSLRNLYRAGFYDPSSGGKSAKCEGAIAVGGADNQFRIFVFEVWGKNCGYQEALEQFYDFNDRYILHQRFYENKGAQKEVATIISMRNIHKTCFFCGKEHRRFTADGFDTGTKDKDERIRALLQPAYDAGRIYFAQAIDPEHGKHMAEIKRQVTQFPHYPLKDRIDALACLVKNLRIPTTEEEAEQHELEMTRRSAPPPTRTFTEHNYGGYV